MKIKYYVGIDEVGRGPLAGPLTLGMIVLTEKDFRKIKNIPLKDSKKLSQTKRLETVLFLKKNKINFYTTSISAKIIDRDGITKSIKNAINRLLKKYDEKHTLIKLDGSLKAPERFINQETIIKGDEREIVIALASIVAKVKRDLYMIKLARKYPKYRFDLHKGYGTKIHIEAIKKHGVSEVHRINYCKNI